MLKFHNNPARRDRTLDCFKQSSSCLRAKTDATSGVDRPGEQRAARYAGACFEQGSVVVDAGQSVPSAEVARSSGQYGAILQRADDRGWLGKIGDNGSTNW